MKNELETSVEQFFADTAKNGLQLRTGQVEMAMDAAEAIALKSRLP